MARAPGTSAEAGTDAPPRRPGPLLSTLNLVAAIANLTFDSSQTMLDLIAVGFSLGLARRCSGSARSATATGAERC